MFYRALWPTLGVLSVLPQATAGFGCFVLVTIRNGNARLLGGLSLFREVSGKLFDNTFSTYGIQVYYPSTCILPVFGQVRVVSYT